MKELITVAVLLLIGYAFGLIQTGYFLSKIKGVDIKHQGSGNSGATNSLRVMGKKAGIIVLVGDLLKAYIPCMAIRFIYGEPGLGLQPEMMYAYLAAIGFGVVLGHNFPFFMGFKGGKGVASTTGLAMAMDWRILLVGFILFVVIVAATRYVSLGSTVGVATLTIMMSIFCALGQYGLCPIGSYIFYGIGILLFLLCAVRHHANYKRLLNGTENKLGAKKKEAEAESSESAK
ncbi:MAG: glycerol-3-phosphate 1-O-acyltransferase PlsY [Lachnospiraceae bacterium]|nr:glycerol-3-phosphate 1-O-acyltransferase PlsY [Lachnospiraceae bacterium]